MIKSYRQSKDFIFVFYFDKAFSDGYREVQLKAIPKGYTCKHFFNRLKLAFKILTNNLDTTGINISRDSLLGRRLNKFLEIRQT